MEQTKIITEYFNTMKQAQRFLNRMYNKYDNIKLISFPLFSESGMYQFKVIIN